MIQETYTELTNDHKQIIITWIPSYQGIEGNEKSRLLSQRSNNRPNKRSQHLNPTPSSTSFSDQREEWNRIWTTTSRTKIHDIAHHFYQKILNNNISRKERIAMTRLRIEHSKITYEYLLSKTEPPFCTTCNQQITTQHLLHKCRKYRNLRSKSSKKKD